MKQFMAIVTNESQWMDIFLYLLSSKDRQAVTPPFQGTTDKRNMTICMLLLEVDGKGVRMESSVFFFMQNRKKKHKEFFLFILS